MNAVPITMHPRSTAPSGKRCYCISLLHHNLFFYKREVAYSVLERLQHSELLQAQAMLMADEVQIRFK